MPGRVRGTAAGLFHGGLTAVAAILVGLAGGCASAPSSRAVVASWARASPLPSPGGTGQLNPDPAPGQATHEGWVVGRFGDGPGLQRAYCRGPSGELVYPAAADAPADFDARVWVRTRVGGEESLGLAFRWQDAEHYYLARLNSRMNNVRLYRRAAAQWYLLDSRDLPVPVDRWHELDIRAQGTRLVVGLAGDLLLEAEDAAYAQGSLALWADPGSSGCFDDLWLAALPRSADPRE